VSSPRTFARFIRTMCENPFVVCDEVTLQIISIGSDGGSLGDLWHWVWVQWINLNINPWTNKKVSLITFFFFSSDSLCWIHRQPDQSLAGDRRNPIKMSIPRAEYNVENFDNK